MTDRSHRSEPPGDRIPAVRGDDEPGWMDTFTDLDEDIADAVLDGRPAASSASLADLVDVVGALRRRRAAEPVPPMAPTLRAQIDGGQVVALAARRGVRRALILAAAAAAAVVAFGIGAAQNRLPAGIQDVVSTTAERVGVHVGTSEERGQGHQHRSDVADTHAQDGVDRAPGYDGTTPGGAIPAVPNGAGEPAIPAVPPEGNGSARLDHGPDGGVPETEGTVDDAVETGAAVDGQNESGPTTMTEAETPPSRGDGNGSAKADSATKSRPE